MTNPKRILWCLLGILFSPIFAWASCDTLESDFFQTLSRRVNHESQRQNHFEKIRVATGKVTKITTQYPHPHPSQMEVTIDSVLRANYTNKTLTLNRGTSSDRMDFRDFEIGHRYLFAFDSDGEQFYLSNCGTYFKKIR